MSDEKFYYIDDVPELLKAALGGVTHRALYTGICELIDWMVADSPEEEEEQGEVTLYDMLEMLYRATVRGECLHEVPEEDDPPLSENDLEDFRKALGLDADDE